MMRKWAMFFLRLVFSAALIVFILSRMDLAQLAETISSLEVPFIAIGFVWLLLDRVAMAYRWSLLLKSKGIDHSLYGLVKVYFLSSFWGNFLPSSVAPDLIRVYAVTNQKTRIPDILSTVIVDRILGLFSLASVALIAFAFLALLRGTAAESSILIAILATLVLTAGGVALLDWTPVRRLGARLLPDAGRLRDSTARFYDSCREYKSNKAVLAVVLAISSLQNLLFVFVVVMLFLSIGRALPMIYFFAFVPLIGFIGMVPISLGGLGVQEGAFIYFFSQVGVSSHEALTVAIVFRVLTILSSLPGGLVYVYDGFRMRKMSAKPVN